MPGYMLHLAAAKIYLHTWSAQNPFLENPDFQKKFFFGTLFPDATDQKERSHFRDRNRRGKMIEYPELSVFLRRYGEFLDQPDILGYYYHLYVDRRFLEEYIPNVVAFYDKEETITEEKDQVAFVEIKKSGKRIPLFRYLSEEYYYGDYTRLNPLLQKIFGLDIDLEGMKKITRIQEAEVCRIEKLKEDFGKYCTTDGIQSKELRVFDWKELKIFLIEIAEDFEKYI